MIEFASRAIWTVKLVRPIGLSWAGGWAEWACLKVQNWLDMARWAEVANW